MFQNGLNAVHLAAKEGHVNVVTELLKRGANVNGATKVDSNFHPPFSFFNRNLYRRAIARSYHIIFKRKPLI